MEIILYCIEIQGLSRLPLSNSRVATVGCPMDREGGKLTVPFKIESARNSRVRHIFSNMAPSTLLSVTVSGPAVAL